MAVVLLKRVDYLKHLPETALKRLMGIAKRRSFRKGETIFAKREAGAHLCIVQKGRVKIYVRSSPRKQKTFAVIGKGEFFGELALLEGSVRSASAEALEDTTLLLVSRADFKRLLSRDPGFMMLLLRTLAERLRRTNEAVEALLFKNILGRVAKTLLDLNDRAVRGQGQRVAPIRATHQELAAWVGTSREPLSRALSSLRRGGLVRSDDGMLVISSLAKLRRLVGN